MTVLEELMLVVVDILLLGFVFVPVLQLGMIQVESGDVLLDQKLFFLLRTTKRKLLSSENQQWGHSGLSAANRST